MNNCEYSTSDSMTALMLAYLLLLLYSVTLHYMFRATRVLQLIITVTESILHVLLSITL